MTKEESLEFLDDCMKKVKTMSNDEIKDMVRVYNKVTSNRFCTCCGKPMDKGFVVEDGEEYFCTDECLHKYYSEEEYNEMYEKDLAYWTTFY